MSSQQFRNAMSKFATGITIVTSQFDEEIRGMTVNAFMSVSLDPKLITISVDHKTTFYENHKEIKRFGISVLREEQKDISMIFAKQSDKSFEDFSTLDGVPVINNALTTLACTVSQTVEAGDHLLVIAEVDDIQINDGKPILYFDSKYRTLNE
ncbi:flavin reductase (DIM6/NTAB) family NADH-FMN oxidoreductase RutF [Gracilibacillus halotolerans]|uniref:Flavin reductase (DIM6/NTAB) family NADH-FMN oxidoreductase RutF n=1 Tax=Gracilibacillus halotolerans TaxID=74386 RepID=A0A841RNK4_9BACI|nr:flavin reductase family protein [Gracilibacillus halotolerans]MBB6512755.1 flavin reductase (DIM6/NTAB) family NADH-FMN oxidoreductase RutF [Gracilibacillus halotolerans]